MSKALARATFTCNRTLHLRVLAAVRALGAAEPDPGYAVSRLAHSRQSATRPQRDGRPADYVVAALIHDVSHHPLFQMHYYGAQTGDDANAGEAYRAHPWFGATVEFCERYDWLPLEHFAPAVEEVFSRAPAFR
ncbi:MAG TPA: hypothetical protein VHZ03_37605 [Trebonia sp.]|nr:hypothetical protein [Trebonia sp.]